MPEEESFAVLVKIMQVCRLLHDMIMIITNDDYDDISGLQNARNVQTIHGRVGSLYVPNGHPCSGWMQLSFYSIFIFKPSEISGAYPRVVRPLSVPGHPH